ncbi:hypothetical protein DFH28DRAFT_904323 [Melampsora americana]|nr:hypothetical protein DFH28DRAFT_904323 [Melampsora americana]
MSTRSGKRLRSSLVTAPLKSTNRKSGARNQSDTNNRSKRFKELQQNNTSNQQERGVDHGMADSRTFNDHGEDENQPEFTSNYPGLTIDNLEAELSKWTLVELRTALMEQKIQKSRHKNQTPSEIKTLVELIRRDYEKRMLMAALIGGISETMIWELVNEGSKKQKNLNCYARFLAFGKEALAIEVPARGDTAGWGRRNKALGDLWDAKTKDERMVFKDPFFFALAKLPDLSLAKLPDSSSSTGGHVELEDEDVEMNEIEDPRAQVSAPKIHQLSEADEAKYQPIFEELVDIEKLHANHGKPESTDSMATMQLKSLAAFRAAHHDFATVSQRFHIHYHLTALSCDVEDGWVQVFSTNKSFSKWADENMKLSQKFKYYVHGKAVAQEIERKVPQPVDARRAELTRELNKLLGKWYLSLITIQDVHMPGKAFPKSNNPLEVIADKGWPIRVILKRPDSQLLPEELALGFRNCEDSQKKKWLSDIRNGHFTIEKIPASEIVPRPSKKNKSSKKNKTKSIAASQQQTASPVTTQQITPNYQTSSQGGLQSVNNHIQQTSGEAETSRNTTTSNRTQSQHVKAHKTKTHGDDKDESTEYETPSQSESES